MRRVRFRDRSSYVRTGYLENGLIRASSESYQINDVDILPPVEPSKILAVGRNYYDNLEELGHEPPTEARLFFKPPHTIVGHGDTVNLPPGKENVVYEAELGVVIGEQCRNVSETNAMDVIMGYTCVNDISNLDDTDIDPGAVRVKGFDSAAPIGPCVASPDHVPIEKASIELRLNDEVKQDSSTANLVRSVPQIIREITSYVTLERGDIIATGSPAGIAPLSDGDHVAIEIEGIGTLEHTVEQRN